MKALSRRAQARLTELESIREKNPRGVLTPRAVVDAARSRTSHLHDCFQWDDTRAADEYRLYQARHVIAEFVVYLDGGTKGDPVVPFYLSLPNDRKIAGGGYRPTTTVMNNRQLRRQLLQEIRTDFDSFHSRWAGVSILMRELSPVLKAHETFRQEYLDPLPMRKSR
jgi:hypothetical protein